MIKKLRIRFVAVFMISMSVLVLSVTGGIFALMCRSEALNSEQLMNRIASQQHLALSYDFENGKTNEPELFNNIQRNIFLVHYSQKNVFPVSYECQTSSAFDETELYNVALSLNMQSTGYNNNSRGTVELYGNRYRYLLTNNILVLADKTYEINILKRLLVILMTTTIAALILLLALSILLAHWTTLPIAKSWKKQKEFVADASHELKTPLTVIDANIDVVLNNKDSTVESQKKWLGNIKDETKSMSRLVTDLLYIAKVDSNRDSFNPVEFNLSDIVTNISLGFECVAFEHDKSFNSTIQDGIIFNGDPELIKQLLKILLDNAIKYSSDNGNIFLELKQSENQKIQLIVSNDGEIIADEDKKNIFERFYRTDKSRARISGGSGLGLSIAKSIVQRHNGTIYVQTINEKYNTFVITL